MPSKPPTHKPAGQLTLRDNEHLRKRGRAGQQQRRRRLMAEPLCRHCHAKGIVRKSDVPDHIIPLAFGGTDDDDNVQCLCHDCHAIKSALESAHTEGAANHPEWLKPSAIPLTILCGPPASGKTTYILDRANRFDTVIDIDDILKLIDPDYQPWGKRIDTLVFNKAIRVRNAMLGSLANAHAGMAWFIVSAPTKEEREWWASKLNATSLVLLHPGTDECKRRAVARGTPKAIEGIDKWEAHSLKPWRPVWRKQEGFDISGRPKGEHPWNR